MKATLLVILLLLTTRVVGQAPDSLGLDDNPVLSRQEVAFLNKAMKSQRGFFDFAGKKVAFLTGNTGQSRCTKSRYFKDHVQPWVRSNGVLPQMPLVILTEAEKQQSGGYDALVMVWVKMFGKRQRERAVAQLSGS